MSTSTKYKFVRICRRVQIRTKFVANPGATRGITATRVRMGRRQPASQEFLPDCHAAAQRLPPWPIEANISCEFVRTDTTRPDATGSCATRPVLKDRTLTPWPVVLAAAWEKACVRFDSGTQCARNVKTHAAHAFRLRSSGAQSANEFATRARSIWVQDFAGIGTDRPVTGVPS